MAVQAIHCGASAVCRARNNQGRQTRPPLPSARSSDARRLVARRAVTAGLEPSAAQLLRLNLAADTSVALPFPVQRAAALRVALQGVAETLAAKAKPGVRPQRWPIMEWRLHEGQGGAGAGDGEVAQLEVTCNPNAHTSVFDAKAYIALRTAGGIRLNAETRIPALQADLDTFLRAAQA